MAAVDTVAIDGFVTPVTDVDGYFEVRVTIPEGAYGAVTSWATSHDGVESDLAIFNL